MEYTVISLDGKTEIQLKVKNNTCCSVGPQGSVLGLILFAAFISAVVDSWQEGIFICLVTKQCLLLSALSLSCSFANCTHCHCINASYTKTAVLMLKTAWLVLLNQQLAQHTATRPTWSAMLLVVTVTRITNNFTSHSFSYAVQL